MELEWAEYDAEACSVARAVNVLGDRWRVLVLREIFNGVRRFDDIQHHIGVSRSVLAARLANLLDLGILVRQPYREPGDRERHEYRLTEMGYDLRPVLIALMDFGDKWLSDDGPPIIYRHAGCGAHVTTAIVCDEGHRITRGRELVVEPGPGARAVA